MGKIVGIALIMSGVSGYLYQWQKEQKRRFEKIESVILFLQKSVFIMEAENIKIAQLLDSYQTKEMILKETLSEISRRLKLNVYPSGEAVWEAVFKEKEQNWNIDAETFGLILLAGNGFFGRNRGENICFLQKSIKELELQKKKNREKDAKEKKVWIPVGMLGGIMLVILLI